MGSIVEVYSPKRRNTASRVGLMCSFNQKKLIVLTFLESIFNHCRSQLAAWFLGGLDFKRMYDKCLEKIPNKLKKTSFLRTLCMRPFSCFTFCLWTALYDLRKRPSVSLTLIIIIIINFEASKTDRCWCTHNT